MPKGCAHIASTKSTEYPIPRNHGGVIGYPISVICYEFICICSTGVITIGGNNSKTYFMVQILHSNLQKILPSQKQNDLNVIHILGDVIHALVTLKCLLWRY